MRLTLRLLALFVLLTIATLTSFSPISRADESPCSDGCARGYEFCMGQNPPPQAKCAADAANCEAKCNDLEIQ